jgi:CheY-like chemotaxis protein/HPt (histidine-containing phosphotransfer) domain-containing protein
VDDHPVNRLVLMRQVNMLGYSAEQAENSRSAIDMWRAGRFAMVIASCDMPGAEGFELARAIRSIESLEGRPRTAIVGCSTDAGARAQRLAGSGMDAVLGSPIELGKLEEALRRWLPATPSKPPSPGSVRPIDDAVLAEIAAGDVDLARDILLRFHRYNAEDTTLLKGAVRRADVDQVTYASHRIKEASKTIGATALASVCEQLERACRANDWEAVAAHMEDYRAEASRLELFIESFEA